MKAADYFKGWTIDGRGYVMIYRPHHPRAHRGNGYVFEHILIAETALGKSLPIGAEVHHFNEITSDNANNNLVICENHAYHQLLHVRARAMAACGNPDWVACRVCHRYDEPSSLVIGYYKWSERAALAQFAYHAACMSQRGRLSYLKRLIAQHRAPVRESRFAQQPVSGLQLVKECICVAVPPPRFCGCGCGTELSNSLYRGRLRQFIKGHNRTKVYAI